MRVFTMLSQNILHGSAFFFIISYISTYMYCYLKTVLVLTVFYEKNNNNNNMYLNGN